MTKTILTVGEILVEIMAVTPGTGFREPLALTGPFPSGAPAIFIDQVANLGAPAAIVAAVGDDDFGHLNIDRLRNDGVDVSGIAVQLDAVTGTAFVRYRPDGARDFVFNIAHSATGTLFLTDAMIAVIDSADHLHVTGSSLGTPAVSEAIFTAAEAVKSRGGTISFDPNVRREMLDAPGLRDRFDKLLALTDLFLPSDAELLLLADTADEEHALASILDRGVQAIVHKKGVAGARYVDRNRSIALPAFLVEEVDPTGAGDIFSATFVTGWVFGQPADETLVHAMAAGAIAVTRRGPMEGVSTRSEIEAFLRTAVART